MTQIITIDGESYEIDRTVGGHIDEMQTEIETLRNILARVASYGFSGIPCWCQCEGGKHSTACSAASRAISRYPSLTAQA